jgi:hypothetical protein
MTITPDTLPLHCVLTVAIWFWPTAGSAGTLVSKSFDNDAASDFLDVSLAADMSVTLIMTRLSDAK